LPSSPWAWSAAYASCHLGITPYLDLSGDEAAAVTKELLDTVRNDSYPLSWHIRSLKAILAKLKLEGICEPCRHRRCTRRRELS